MTKMLETRRRLAGTPRRVGALGPSASDQVGPRRDRPERRREGGDEPHRSRAAAGL